MDCSCESTNNRIQETRTERRNLTNTHSAIEFIATTIAVFVWVVFWSWTAAKDLTDSSDPGGWGEYDWNPSDDELRDASRYELVSR
jgi:hypothetical protein